MNGSSSGQQVVSIGGERSSRHGTVVPVTSDLSARGDIPEARSLVVAGGNDSPAIRREDNALDRPLVSQKVTLIDLFLKMPKPDGSAQAAGNRVLPCGREGDAFDGGRQSVRTPHFTARLDVPEANRVVAATGDDLTRDGVRGDAHDRLFVSFQTASLPSSPRIPNANRSVLASRYDRVRSHKIHAGYCSTMLVETGHRMSLDRGRPSASVRDGQQIPHMNALRVR